MISMKVKLLCQPAFAYQYGDAEAKSFWSRTMIDGDIKQGDLERAILLISHDNVQERISTIILQRVEKAMQALSQVPDSDIKSLLLKLPSWVASRIDL